MKKQCWFLWASFAFWHSPSEAQNQPKSDYQLFSFYVLFGSACCGIDQKAYTALHEHIKKFQKKNRKKLAYETLYWGKEGERAIYFDLMQLTDNQAITFYERTQELMNHKAYTLVKVGWVLNLHTSQNTLWVHCIPVSINQKREDKFLTFIEKFEAENQVKILRGAMINETRLIEDQDKRYELSLQTLSERQKSELLTGLKAIFSVEKYPKTH
ncbi:MAG: hypothetical protein MUE85_17825 [Microscillaceae bacterium]|jgi:hypothetical protein|nr:hypothetical protein [Microscillaceae bacterium]